MMTDRIIDTYYASFLYKIVSGFFDDFTDCVFDNAFLSATKYGFFFTIYLY